MTLRSLERDGPVARIEISTIPPRVDYDVTPPGRSLRQPIDALTEWALDHHGWIARARESFDKAENR